MTRWNPGRYLSFSDHRLRPAVDLIARIPLRSPAVICDLGCGTGNVTRLLAERWPAARVRGVDSSADMLARARAEDGGIAWIEADVASWTPEEPPDLLFSNAALHWVAGHRELFPRLVGMLRPGGCLAVQMPLSWDAPSHRLLRETLAAGGPGGTPLASDALRRTMARRWVEDAEVYHDLLAPRADAVDVWETEYLHALDGEDPVLEWVRGTVLRPVLGELEGERREAFLAAYRRRLRAAYPPRPDGRTLFRFRRLFVVVLR